MRQVSIVGRNFETREDVGGFYRPEDAALEGVWFGLMLGAMGFFVFPMVGMLMVMRP